MAGAGGAGLPAPAGAPSCVLRQATTSKGGRAMKLPLIDVDIPPTEAGVTTACGPRSDRPRLAVRSHGRTDPGRVRASNEDQFLIATLTRALRVQTSLPQQALQCGPPQGHLLAVADGVGGNKAGGRASALALRAIEGFVLDTLNWCAHLR